MKVFRVISAGKTLSGINMPGLFIALYFIALSTIAISAPLDDLLIRFTPDDAYYYLETARHTWLGQGPTFDGINRTNGYHPLWLALLAPFSHAMDTSRETGARLAFITGILFVSASFITVLFALKSLWPDGANIGLYWYMASASLAAVYALETPVVALLLSLLLYLTTRIGSLANPAKGMMLGFLAALLVLSRLDTIVYTSAFAALWLLHIAKNTPSEQKRSAFLALLCMIIVQGAILSAYVAANHLYFGAFLPVSAMIKISRQPGPNIFWLNSMLSKLAVVSALLSVIALYKSWNCRGLFSVRVAALGTILHVIFLAFKGSAESYNWYFLPPVMAGAYVISFLAEEYYRNLVKYSVMTACILILSASIYGKTHPSDFKLNLQKALWISKHAPREAVFAENDCGILGYFSERPFINTDGLVNSFDFQNSLANGAVSSWLISKGFNSVVVASGEVPADGKIRLRIPAGIRSNQKVLIVHTAETTKAQHDGAFSLLKVLSIEPD